MNNIVVRLSVTLLQYKSTYFNHVWSQRSLDPERVCAMLHLWCTTWGHIYTISISFLLFLQLSHMWSCDWSKELSCRDNKLHSAEYQSGWGIGRCRKVILHPFPVIKGVWVYICFSRNLCGTSSYVVLFIFYSNLIAACGNRCLDTFHNERAGCEIQESCSTGNQNRTWISMHSRQWKFH